MRWCTSKDFFYIQNAVLGLVVAKISSKLVQILCSSNPRSTNATSLLIGAVAASALLTISQNYRRYQRSIGAIWVVLTPTQLTTRNIQTENIKTSITNKFVYLAFRREPVDIEGAKKA